MILRVLILWLGLVMGPVVAQETSPQSSPSAFPATTFQELPEPVQAVLPPPDVSAVSWMLVDFSSGWILGSKDSDRRIEPASLTKLMTAYLVFEALERGEIQLTDEVYVSRKAWKTGGSRMFIQVDTHVDVESLLKGLIIQSGNDAAVALAELLGGSEEGFAVQMNHKAAELGMSNSRFTNSHGLPNENHYSTAEDILILSRALIRNFPDRLSFYSTREYTYNEITQKNRNKLLWRDDSVDGLKTGYTRAAGYCLVGTANRDGYRLLAIVTGTESSKVRSDAVYSLLQYGYAAYEKILLYRPGDEVARVKLWKGAEPEASIGVSHPLHVLYPKGKRELLSASLDLPDSLDAPLTVGSEVGGIQVKYNGDLLLVDQLELNADYPSGPWWSRLKDSLLKLMW